MADVKFQKSYYIPQDLDGQRKFQLLLYTEVNKYILFIWVYFINCFLHRIMIFLIIFFVRKSDNLLIFPYSYKRLGYLKEVS